MNIENVGHIEVKYDYVVNDIYKFDFLLIKTLIYRKSYHNFQYYFIFQYEGFRQISC